MSVYTQEVVASGKQVNFIKVLAERKDMSALDAEVTWQVQKVQQTGGISKADASALINTLLSQPDRQAAQVVPGFYVKGEEVYEVILNKAGTHTYAKKMVVENKKGRWVFVPGAVKTLGDLKPLSLAEAAALGMKYVCCMICGRTLTNPESRERGIGPICAGRL